MTLRIERARARIRLSGEFRSEHLDQVKAEIELCESPRVLDLEELDLIDVESVRFLNACEAKGISVLHLFAVHQEMDVERTKSLTETRTKSEDRKRQHWALRVAAEMAVGFQIHQEFKEKIVISVMNRPRAAGDSTSVGRLYAVRIFERSANNDQKLCAP